MLNYQIEFWSISENLILSIFWRAEIFLNFKEKKYKLNRNK